MVIASRRLDPVAQRLAAAGHAQSASLLQWLEGQQQRNIMRRRASLCMFGGWLLVTTAAIVSSVVAIWMSRGIRAMFLDDMMPQSGLPKAVIVLPWVLFIVALALVIFGVAGWLRGRIPGFSGTASAIDWAAASDAVTRLLSVGCTYPEAFRTAATITRSAPSRNWLMQAASRVEAGGPQVAPSSQSDQDASMLESLIDASQSEPQRQWKLAADHFLELARQRLVLLLQSMPMLSTIISGLLIWIAISVTLGWMWRFVARMCGDLT